MNAITYKEIFPLIKENKIWFGYGFNCSMIFKTQYENTLDANRKYVISKGYNPDENYIKTPAVCWYTNIDNSKRNETITTGKTYYGYESMYPQYDNYDAIEVSKVSDIPMDYDGVMGVPITFLDKHNPQQFDVVGLAAGNSRATGLYYSVPYTPHPEDRGGCGVVNNTRKYARILIKKHTKETPL